jgi:serine/threonine protein kinase
VVKVSRLVDDQHLSLCNAEFELLKRLEDNPGVVNVRAFYVEIQTNLYYLVMERVHGRSLEMFVASGEQ